MSSIVTNVAIDAEHTMLLIARLNLFQVNHLALKILVCWLQNLIVCVGCKHAEGARRCPFAPLRKPERNIVKVVDRISASLQKRANIIRPPERGKYVDKGFIGSRRDIGFRNKHGNTGWQAVIAPHLKNIGDQTCFVVEVAPMHLAGSEGVMFEGHKRKIGYAVMGFQIIKKTAHPGSSAASVRPNFYVFVYAFEDWASQF